MARIVGHLPVAELEARYRTARDATEARHFQAIWLLAQGRTFLEVAEVLAFVPRWVEELAARYNAFGPGALGDYGIRVIASTGCGFLAGTGGRKLAGYGSGAAPWRGSSGISPWRSWRRGTGPRGTGPRRGTYRRSGPWRRGAPCWRSRGCWPSGRDRKSV